MEKIPFLSPEVEIIEIDIMNIICQSGGTEQYGEGSTNDWFK